MFTRGASLVAQLVKESACNAGDPSLIPGLGRSAGEGTGYPLQYSWASLVGQLVKNPPAMRETWVQSLGWEDPRRRERLPTPVFWPGEFHGHGFSQPSCIWSFLFFKLPDLLESQRWLAGFVGNEASC